ncbi:MAG: hypothetical protein HZC02_03600 [Candidatus Levybacteria bacterium]|nr:hypothetical protein [Candidatus Levybacteria bacterium]
MGDSEKAILRTLIYSDCFSSPLSYEELYIYFHGSKKITKRVFERSLKDVEEFILAEKGLYTLRGSRVNIEKRLMLASENERKNRIALSMARLLSSIPTIQFIGVTGSLAVKNASAADDIDFFIITKNHALYITRLLSLFLLQLWGRRRKKIESNPKDKICINMFVTMRGIASLGNEKNIYKAREIAQIKPLFDRDNTYEQLLKQNKWVYTFLPNFFPKTTPYTKKSSSVSNIVMFFEIPARALQVRKFKFGKKSMEDDKLIFYPKSRNKSIQQCFLKRLLFYSKYYSIDSL